jgi:tripartite-type tricarboxylate transporter receptor subunit TctC
MGAAQVAYWENALRAMTESAEWKQLLEKRAWVDRYAGAEGCRAAFKVQYDQMHAGLQELGLAKR